MTDSGSRTTMRLAAVVAGGGLLLMTASWLLTDWLVLRPLVVPGEAATTADNLAASRLLYRGGILGVLVVLVCDVVVAWALYVFLTHVDQALALLAAWLRLVYAGALGIALSKLVEVLVLLSGADYLVVYEVDRVQARVLLSLEAFNEVWGVGLIIFGLHLLVLGYLVLKSELVPRILGVLLVVAGAGYLVEYGGKVLSPGFDAPISSLVGWGELVLAFWLLIRGGVAVADHPLSTREEVRLS